jgi:peptidoglycan/LPS O-acetylase OafA/YrhL
MKNTYHNLDLLRSMAVLAVVVWHMYQQSVVFHLAAYNSGVEEFLVNLSFTGVMFFFVHTCLVLMLSMHRAPEPHRARTFLIRRAFRIYPLCWATIAIALATGLTDEAAGNFHDLGWRGVVINLLLVHNILRGHVSVIGPLWSLDWEVQMYLLLPLFFLALRRFNRLVVVFALWLAATLLSIAATQPVLPRILHAAVFPPLFIAGMVAYRLLIRQSGLHRKPSLPAWGWPLVILGLFVLQGQLAAFHHPYVSAQLTGINLYESPQSAAVNGCVCLVLALAIPLFGEIRASWIVAPAKQIAKYSYGIYLLHIPAMILILRCFPRLPLGAKAAAFLALTALLSFASFHTIEDPLIKLGKRLTQAVPKPAGSAERPRPELFRGSSLSDLLPEKSGEGAGKHWATDTKTIPQDGPGAAMRGENPL